MGYRAKKFGKYVLIFVAWIFCLSIRLGDKTVFDHAHGVLVDNKIVLAIDQEISDLWLKVTTTARVAYGRMSGQEQSPEDEENTIRSG